MRSRADAALDLLGQGSVATDERLIGATVDDHLEATLWRLVAGEIGLHQLTPALAGFWSLAYDQGRASRQAELDRANADADRYYRAAYDTREHQLRRIDIAAENYWQDFMSGRTDLTELPSRKEEAA
jgi:hypothetical protein